MQSAFLRHINHNIENREQMLDFVGQYQFMLDPVNKVTCIYRLAKMFTSPQIRCDQRWKNELSADDGFNRLLRGLSSDLVGVWLEINQNGMLPPGPRALTASPNQPRLRQASNGTRTPSPDTPGEAHDTPPPPPPHKPGGGADYARCLSNLIWALVKLELVDKPDSVAAALIMDITPLVLHFIPRYNSQGIANIIWSYAKLPAPPVTAVLKLLQHMTYMLGEPSEARSFDAQALSNSIWAAAHMSSKGVVTMEGDTSSELAKFLVAVAGNACYQLRALEFDRPRYQAYQYLKVTETKFACQALVNIAWSFATLLSGCARQNASILNLFQHIRTEGVFRLKTLRAIMESGDLSVARSSGSFNEQALSNLVFAYEKVELLDGELLGAVFAVANLRLQGLQHSILLKPQEVCTLLRAARLEVADPWPFIASLQRLLATSTSVSAHWTEVEKAEVMSALQSAVTHQRMLQQRVSAAAAQAMEDAKQREQLQLQMHLQEEQQRRQQQQQRRRQQELAVAQHAAAGFAQSSMGMPMYAPAVGIEQQPFGMMDGPSASAGTPLRYGGSPTMMPQMPANGVFAPVRMLPPRGPAMRKPVQQMMAPHNSRLASNSLHTAPAMSMADLQWQPTSASSYGGAPGSPQMMQHQAAEGDLYPIEYMANGAPLPTRPRMLDATSYGNNW